MGLGVRGRGRVRGRLEVGFLEHRAELCLGEGAVARLVELGEVLHDLLLLLGRDVRLVTVRVGVRVRVRVRFRVGVKVRVRVRDRVRGKG